MYVCLCVFVLFMGVVRDVCVASAGVDGVARGCLVCAGVGDVMDGCQEVEGDARAEWGRLVDAGVSDVMDFCDGGAVAVAVQRG